MDRGRETHPDRAGYRHAARLGRRTAAARADGVDRARGARRARRLRPVQRGPGAAGQRDPEGRCALLAAPVADRAAGVPAALDAGHRRDGPRLSAARHRAAARAADRRSAGAGGGPAGPARHRRSHPRGEPEGARHLGHGRDRGGRRGDCPERTRSRRARDAGRPARRRARRPGCRDPHAVRAHAPATRARLFARGVGHVRRRRGVRLQRDLDEARVRRPRRRRAGGCARLAGDDRRRRRPGLPRPAHRPPTSLRHAGGPRHLRRPRAGSRPARPLSDRRGLGRHTARGRGAGGLPACGVRGCRARQRVVVGGPGQRGGEGRRHGHEGGFQS